MRPRVVQLFALEAVRAPGTPRAEHLYALYDDGHVEERFSDQEPGEWADIPLPKLTYNTSRKARKKK